MSKKIGITGHPLYHKYHTTRHYAKLNNIEFGFESSKDFLDYYDEMGFVAGEQIVRIDRTKGFVKGNLMRVKENA